ncbi:unnamed protein product [Spirodela intermedia]|uniref:Uncharacterized protein n=1 Tax=Spirodela intermedia TaxID=51605 RepID=A0A7I8IP84_SPIIN|nr:unnamed protein product [Spirodela intermedia]CAA6659580.1 unnamed protein product [Spirodela intermedia]
MLGYCKIYMLLLMYMINFGILCQCNSYIMCSTYKFYCLE